ncbi:MAG: rhomboid family intramembrane serine protease [Halanaerobiales bacterium]
MNRRIKWNITKGILKGFFRNISITFWLIGINIAMFIIFLIVGYFSEPLFGISNKIFFDNFIALKPINILQGKALWTFITSMFMHGGIGHLLINMFVLFSLGGVMERIIGRKRFLWFYIISGIFASLVFVLLAGFFGNSEIGAAIFGSPTISAVGASGAIFAIAGLFVVILPKAKFTIIFFPFFSLPGYIMVPGILVITWIASVVGGLPIGNSAHFGGFLAGIVYGFYLRKNYKRKIKRLNRMIRQ